MIVNDFLEIGLKIGADEIDIDPINFSLSIHDSIHSFYNTASLIIKDITGLYKETLLSCEGNVYEIFMASRLHDKVKLKSKFVVTKDEVQESLAQGVLAGQLKIDLVGAFYDEQTIESKAYKSSLSDITKECAEGYYKENLNIDEVGCKSIWYQLSTNVKDFLEDVVLKNAYDKSNDGFPFFMYTSNDGSFNFKNIKKLFEKGSVATLTLSTNSQESFSEVSIIDIKQFKTGSEISKKFRNKEYTLRNRETGEYTKKNRDIKKNLIESTKVPIVGDISKVTDYEHYGFTKKKASENDALKGRLIQTNRKEFFIDRHIITTHFNPTLNSGAIVDLALYIPSGENSGEIALYQSGNYIIEDCVHSWDHTTQGATTTIIVGRKSSSIPAFKLTGKLI